MAADIGAVGDRGLHSCNSRTNRIAKGASRIGKSLVLKKTRFAATVVVVLLVGVFAVVLVQGHTPSSTRLSRSYTLAYLLWTDEADETEACFGYSVSSAGDVNDDGYEDVIVGSVVYDNGEANEGCAFLYLGSPIGLSETPSWTAECNQAHASFAYSVSSSGDVNNDGYDDVVVGAPQYDNPEYGEGSAYLYLGSSGGLSTTPSWTVEGDQAQAYLGWSVSSAGDVNNDGYDDVVIGAYQYSNGSSCEGRAFLYLGSSTGLSTTPSWTAESDLEHARFGSSVSSAGDVNNDGYDDVVIGALVNDKTTVKGGAYLYLGSSTGLSASPSWTAEGDEASAQFGNSVSSAGDVNNDGYDDVVIGAPHNETLKGSAHLYLGSPTGLSASPSWTTETGQVGDRFGWSVSSAGDVDNDGYDDVVVGARSALKGRAYLYLGSSGGLSTTPSWTAESDQNYSGFGYSVSSAGDVNRDGYDEVLVGAPWYANPEVGEGRAYLYGELLIPEFKMLLIPVIGVVAIIVALRRTRTIE